MELIDKKKELKLLVSKNVIRGIEELESILDPDSFLLNDLCLVSSKMNSIKEEYLKNTISRENYDTAFSKICEATLEFIDKLSNDDIINIDKYIITDLKHKISELIEQNSKLKHESRSLHNQLKEKEAIISSFESFTYSNEPIIDKVKWWESLEIQWKIILTNSLDFEFSRDDPTKNEYLKKRKNLELLLSVKELDVVHNMKNISNFRNLNDFRDLRELRVYCVNFNDLEPLRNLTQLEVLDIQDTTVRTLKPILGLKKLKKIYCNSIINKYELKEYSTIRPNCKIVLPGST